MGASKCLPPPLAILAVQRPHMPPDQPCLSEASSNGGTSRAWSAGMARLGGGGPSRVDAGGVALRVVAVWLAPVRPHILADHKDARAGQGGARACLDADVPRIVAPAMAGDSWHASRAAHRDSSRPGRPETPAGACLPCIWRPCLALRPMGPAATDALSPHSRLNIPTTPHPPLLVHREGAPGICEHAPRMRVACVCV